MTRNQLTLAGLLVVQVVLIFLVSGPLATSTLPVESRALLEGLDGFQPARLEVLGAEADKKVTLVKTGDAWGIEEAGGYPAQADKVDKLVSTLEELQVRRPVVNSSRYHEALKVTDGEHERRVRLWGDPSGAPKVDLFLGTSPNYRATHVRLEGEDPVFEVSGLGVYDVRDTASGWIDTKLLDIELKDVTGFTLQNAAGAIEMEKMADGEWRLVSPARKVDLDRGEIESLVRAAAQLNVADPAGPIDRAAQGFEGGASITLRVNEPSGDAGKPAAEDAPAGEAPADAAAAPAAPKVREVTVWVGSVVPDKDTQRFVAQSDFGFAARVWKGSVDKIADTKLKDLEKKKEDAAKKG